MPITSYFDELGINNFKSLFNKTANKHEELNSSIIKTSDLLIKIK